MRRCSDCGSEVSREARTCDDCGFPLNLSPPAWLAVLVALFALPFVLARRLFG